MPAGKTGTKEGPLLYFHHSEEIKAGVVVFPLSDECKRDVPHNLILLHTMHRADHDLDRIGHIDHIDNVDTVCHIDHLDS